MYRKSSPTLYFKATLPVFVGEKPFDFPLHTFHGTKDSRITAQMVQGWAEFTTGTFTETAVDGNHLWPLDRAAKAQWLQCIADKLQWTMQRFSGKLDRCVSQAKLLGPVNYIR